MRRLMPARLPGTRLLNDQASNLSAIVLPFVFFVLLVAYFIDAEP